LPFRPTSVVVHPAAQDRLDGLAHEASEGKRPAQAIWKGFQAAVARLKEDGQWGEVIPPRSIPRRVSRDFGATNLYCIDFPSFHRLFYTIRDRDVILLDLVDQPQYDRLMRS
jgi:hypothetical protein